MNPAGFHAVNPLLHAANAVVLLFIAQRLLGGSAVIASSAAALAFAIHPLRVESVAWITERCDMMSVLFSLLCAALASRVRRASSVSVLVRVVARGLCLRVVVESDGRDAACVVPRPERVLNVFPLQRIFGPAGW
jgi:hypothetical protein